jgi:ribosomal protein L7Ae-like RNA K-turn-binding protein
MQAYRYIFALLVMTLLLTLSACGAGNSNNSKSPASDTPAADFFQLAIVPNQTVSASTFEVQAIAELFNPNAGTLVPPSVIDGSGNSHAMAPKVLKWPGTAEDSVTIWSATIPLVSDQVNNIKVVSGTKELPFAIRHKSALSVLTASNPTQLVNDIKAAITDPSIDVIQVAYDEPNLGSAINGVGENGGVRITNNRTTWLTIKPATGNTISWVRDSGAPLARPHVDLLHISNVTFGSDISDEGGGTFYVEANHRAWVSEIEFRGQYKSSWSKTTRQTAVTVPDVRTSLTEGQKVYFTDCLWDGTATDAATSSAELARDLRLNSHRGDLNDFGKVVLNLYAQDIETIRNAGDTDYLHNDGFQIWGNVGTSNLVFKGLKIVSPHVPSDIQPFLLDRSFTPDYQNVLLDSLLIVGAAPGTILQAQIAGHLTNSRISNLSFPNQNLTLRYDFTDPNGAFLPTNVFISNLEVKKVLYVAPAGGTSITYDYQSVNNTNNISSELSANPVLSGVTFTNIKVLSGP